MKTKKISTGDVIRELNEDSGDYELDLDVVCPDSEVEVESDVLDYDASGSRPRS